MSECVGWQSVALTHWFVWLWRCGSCRSSNRNASTVIRFVEDAVQHMNYKAPDSAVAAPPVAATDRPSIVAAATHWSLNSEQFAAFVPMACAVLDIVLTRLQALDATSSKAPKPPASSAASVQALTSEELERIKTASSTLRDLISASKLNINGAAPSEESISEEPSASAVNKCTSMFMLITGSGGTGKSRVIHCLRDFARRWFMSSALRVSATTGSAAANIQAGTWQSVVGDHFKRSANATVSEELRRVWSSVGIMIVDEISMAGAVTLVRLNQRLQALKASNALFGGIHMVVLGDFWQLGAVRQAPVYGSRGSSKSDPKTAATNAQGFKIWHQLTNGTELVTNMRAAQDKPFAAMLENFRTSSNVTQQQINHLNETCAITASRQPPAGAVL